MSCEPLFLTVKWEKNIRAITFVIDFPRPAVSNVCTSSFVTVQSQEFILLVMVDQVHSTNNMLYSSLLLF